MKNLSIIVPHYNTPQLLEKLLSSIAFNDNTEVLVIDDKSDKFIDEYHSLKQRWESKVTFFDNDTEKKGAGVCRNLGLARATGKWLLFADADDYFVSGYHDILCTYFESNYSMVYFMPDSVSLETGLPAHRHEAYKQLLEAYLNSPSEKTLYELIFTYVTPWGKLIRSDIVRQNGIQFDETIVANDVMFMTSCAYCSREKVAIDKAIIYCVTRMAKTLTTKKDESKFDVRSDVFLRRFTFLKERLKKKQLSYVHLDRIAISHVINALMYGYGLVKAFKVFLRYRKNGVHFFDIELLNPVIICKQASMYLKWRREDRKLQ